MLTAYISDGIKLIYEVWKKGAKLSHHGRNKTTQLHIVKPYYVIVRAGFLWQILSWI